MFSSRLPARLAPNAVSLAVDARRRAGAPLLDLTETNPTAVGLSSQPDILSSLADPRAVRYEPAPLGLRAAREAVAGSYRRPGVDIDPGRVVLAASTSEAYAWLFKCLCDPGDEILIPRPSYPLFDLLSTLEGVVARPYRLDDHGVWSIDRDSVEATLSRRTRALLVVTPNNPTGSMLRAADRDWLATLCAARDLAIISDEVFADFPLTPRPDACSLVGEARALTFVLGGLSKSAGLPQVKLAWMLADGPAPLVDDALARLEVIADTFLSVSTPVQIAAPRLIAGGGVVRDAIRARVTGNLATLRAGVRAHPAVTLREPEGGWSAVLEVPALGDEDALVLRLIDAGVLVHPGYFFDFPAEAFLVVSLLPDPGVFAEAIARLLPVAAGAPA
jgi:aspartate/methionine/tyrosine aminotransferase